MYVCYKLNIEMMKKLLFTLLLLTTSTLFSQYRNRDGNRIGISAGVSHTTLFTSNFDSKPGIGFAGGLSVRGNYYNNWSMIYGMQFFYNKFGIASNASDKQTDFNVQGAQVRLLLSYNVVEDHVSFDFGPVLQINGKLGVDEQDKSTILNGTAITAKQMENISKINGNFYVGFSAGSKVVRAVVFYEYGFTNIFNKLNDEQNLQTFVANEKLKGNLGTINGQIIFNL
jgi:hypothetical protein